MVWGFESPPAHHLTDDPILTGRPQRPTVFPDWR